MNSRQNEFSETDVPCVQSYRTKQTKYKRLLVIVAFCALGMLLASMSFTRVSGLTSELFAAGITENSYVLAETDPCYDVDVDVEMITGGLSVFRTAVSLLRTPTEPETDATTEPDTTETMICSGPARLNCMGVPISGIPVPDSVVLDSDGIPVNYSQVIYGTATAYSNDTITSTGTVPVQGSVAVDPDVIPYGTEMWIVSSDGQYVYGYCRAEDTGGFIYMDNGPDVDLYFDYESDCEEWGIRNVTIYIF